MFWPLQILRFAQDDNGGVARGGQGQRACSGRQRGSLGMTTTTGLFRMTTGFARDDNDSGLVQDDNGAMPGSVLSFSRPVILSAAKNLMFGRYRSFASLRMTTGGLLRMATGFARDDNGLRSGRQLGIAQNDNGGLLGGDNWGSLGMTTTPTYSAFSAGKQYWPGVYSPTRKLARRGTKMARHGTRTVVYWQR